MATHVAKTDEASELIKSKELSGFWDAQEVEHSDDEDVSASITQTWTEQSLKCYATKANCAKCSIPRGHYSFDCQMNKVVPVLLKTLGSPEPSRLQKLMPYINQEQGL